MKIDITITDEHIVIDGKTYRYADILRLLEQSKGNLIDISEPANSGYSHQVSTIQVNEHSTIIAGSGFGNGPNIILDERFEDGVTGEVINLGNWTEYGTNKPVYSNISYSGKHSMRTYAGKRMLQIKKQFANATEIFVSYRVRVPQSADSFFPGTYWYREDGTVGRMEAANSYTFPKDSAWKFCWLLQDGEYGRDYANLCLPSYIGSGGKFSIAGNDNSVMDLPWGQSWWSWNHWNRISIWLKAADDPLLSGDAQFQSLSVSNGLMQLEKKTSIFDADGPAEKYFNSINFPGWIRPGSQTVILYDDIYMATGPNAVCRVEAGDSPVYKDCTRLEILPVSSWRDDEIILANTTPGYLYITDNRGRVNSNGYRTS